MTEVRFRMLRKLVKTDIRMKKALPTILIFFLGFLFSACDGDVAEKSETVLNVPVQGMVTMVDLGAKECIPCKMMAPILKKLKSDYKGKAAIIFIDIRKSPEHARRFGIRVMPTQIFFDRQGKEVFRHEGFMSEKDIVSQLAKMGVA